MLHLHYPTDSVVLGIHLHYPSDSVVLGIHLHYHSDSVVLGIHLHYPSDSVVIGICSISANLLGFQCPPVSSEQMLHPFWQRDARLRHKKWDTVSSMTSED